MWVKLTRADQTDKETETQAAEALMSNVIHKLRLEPLSQFSRSSTENT